MSTEFFSLPHIAPSQLVVEDGVATPNGDKALTFFLELDDDITLQSMINGIEGQIYTFIIQQDFTGNHSLSFGGDWSFTLIGGSSAGAIAQEGKTIIQAILKDTFLIVFNKVFIPPFVIESLSPGLREVSNSLQQQEIISVALSDELTELSATEGVVKIPVPFKLQFVKAKAFLSEPSSSGDVVIDIKLDGTSIFTGFTKLTLASSETIDEKYTVADDSWNEDQTLTFDIDSDGTGAKGLKVFIYGWRVS